MALNTEREACADMPNTDVRHMEHVLRYELFQERIARQRAETRLADCQRQLADTRRELHWLQGFTAPAGSRLRWTADDGPDLNKVVC